MLRTGSRRAASTTTALVDARAAPRCVARDCGAVGALGLVRRRGEIDGAPRALHGRARPDRRAVVPARRRRRRRGRRPRARRRRDRAGGGGAQQPRRPRGRAPAARSCTGSCTCSGYDHEEDAEKAEMWARQERYSGVTRAVNWLWILAVRARPPRVAAGDGRGLAHPHDAGARALPLEEDGRRNAALLVKLETDPPRYLNSIYLTVMIVQNGSAILVAILAESDVRRAWASRSPRWSSRSCTSCSSRRWRRRSRSCIPTAWRSRSRRSCSSWDGSSPGRRAP